MSLTGSQVPYHPLLTPLSWLFAGGVAARNAIFDSGLRTPRRLAVPVISVGNLSVGGTGKTPVVALLSRELATRGRRPAVVSRGHGGSNARATGAPVLVVNDGRGGTPPPAALCGDEPRLLASLIPDIPVLVCRDRRRAGLTAVDRMGADLIILDDGFQHRRLHRDADLLTLSPAEILGVPRLLPAGPMREPMTSGRRAHVAVVTRARAVHEWTRSKQRLETLIPGLPVFREQHLAVAWRRAQDPPGTGGLRTLEVLSGARIVAFAGLAHPGALQASLEELGARVLAMVPFPDHHAYSDGDLARLEDQSGAAGALLATTAKDAVRLDPGRSPAGLMVLDVEASIADLDGLCTRLLDLCIPGAAGPHLSGGGGIC